MKNSGEQHDKDGQEPGRASALVTKSRARQPERRKK